VEKRIKSPQEKKVRMGREIRIQGRNPKGVKRKKRVFAEEETLNAHSEIEDKPFLA